MIILWNLSLIQSRTKKVLIIVLNSITWFSSTFNANRYFDLTISTCSHWFYDAAVWILLLLLVEQYNIHNILCFKLFGLRNCSIFDPTITSSTIIVGQLILLPGWPINLEFSEIREKSGNLILTSKVRELSGNVRKSWPKSKKKI